MHKKLAANAGMVLDKGWFYLANLFNAQFL